VARVDDALRRGAKDGRVGAFLSRLNRYPSDDQAKDGYDAAARGADGTPGRDRQGANLAKAVAEDAGDSAAFHAQVIAQGDEAPKETAIDPSGPQRSLRQARRPRDQPGARHPDPGRFQRLKQPDDAPVRAMSIESAAGTRGRPGMVMISPQIATTNSAPPKA